MKMLSHSNTRGSVLVMVMVLLLAFSMLTVSLLQTGRDSSLQSIQEQRNAQAHWVAEAGLEKTLAMIKASKNYRNNPQPISGDLEGSNPEMEVYYAVTVDKTDGPGLEESTYLIESTGTVSTALISAEATVRVRVTGAPGVDQGFIALGGQSKIKSASSVNITADIYIAGDGEIGKNANIYGTLEDGDDAYDLPDPAIDVPYMDFPIVDRTPYQALVNTAATYPSTNFSGSITFDGTTNYYNGNVTITGISGSGGGSVVATGSITVTDKLRSLPQGTALVAGTDIVFSTLASTAGNNELFAFGDITFISNTQINGTGNSLLAMGGISLSANASPFAGIIYAEGKYSGSDYGVIFAGGTQDDMRGTVIAWYGFDIESNLTFTYDSSVFPDSNPLGDVFDGFVRTEKLQWEENPYN
jgi:hypothetical protein